MNIKIAIQHDRSQIKVVSKTVRYLCALAEAGDHPAVKNIELALVELLTNIIDHSKTSTDSEIEVHCRFDGELFTLDVTDSGQALSSEQVRAYTSEQIVMPDLASCIDSLPESGWGVQLIKSACDRVSYQRENQRNCYQLTFDLSASVCE